MNSRYELQIYVINMLQLFQQTQHNFILSKEHEKIAMELDYEKSQLMGGDLENTHLVKGLDRTLLRKVKGIPPPNASSLPPGMTPGNIKETKLAQKVSFKPLSEIPTVSLFGKKIQGFLCLQERHKKIPLQMRKESTREVAVLRTIRIYNPNPKPNPDFLSHFHLTHLMTLM